MVKLVIAKSATRLKPIAILMLALLWIFCQASDLIADEFDANQVAAAFESASGGYSTDEVLIRDDLRQRFLDELIPPDSTDDKDRRLLEASAMLQLLKLRKAGKLTTKATRRGQTVDDSIAPVAEIAARVVTDRHRVSTDTILADPKLRDELQSEAELIVPGVDAYAVRKLVLSLRKKRALKPELVLQVADWDTAIQTVALEQLKERLRAGAIPDSPGVYLFRGDQGYLYIGEAANLAKRLSQHVGGSDRESLAEYLAGDAGESVSVELHVFSKDSPAKKLGVRRAYESELIRSRQPRFNVRP